MLLSGDRIDYTIDGQNRRIGKKLNGQIVKRWVYAGSLLPIAELDSTGSVVAQFMGNEMYKDGALYQLITDHLGSVRLVVKINDGTIIQRLDYDEFGNVLYDSNPDFQPFAYADGLYDSQTKLTRFGARDYDASAGRWTCKDPIGFGGGETSLYGYVGNDPVNFVDPDGITRWPTKYRVVTSPFGQRGDEFHNGVDIRNPLGEPVYSTDAGIVKAVYYNEKGGNQIIIYNSDGSISGYAHTLSSNIQKGSKVEEGQIIGYSDASGGVVPHLHYTYRPSNTTKQINPMEHFKNTSDGNEDCDKTTNNSGWENNLMNIVKKVFNWLYN